MSAPDADKIPPDALPAEIDEASAGGLADPRHLRPSLLLLPLFGMLSVPSFLPASESAYPLMAAAAACPDSRRTPKAPARPPATPAPREPRSPSCVHCRAPLIDAPLA